MARILAAIVTTSGAGIRAWHPFGMLDGAQWLGLGANELLIHASDICAGLELPFRPAASTSDAVLSDVLALHNRARDTSLPTDPFAALLQLSGRAAPV